MTIVIGVISIINSSYADTGTCVSKGDDWEQFFHGTTTTLIQTDPKDNEQDGVMLIGKEGSGSCMVGCMDTYCHEDMPLYWTSACATGERLSAMASNNDTQCEYMFYRKTPGCPDSESGYIFAVGAGSALGGAIISGVLTTLVLQKWKKGYSFMR